MKIFWIPVLYLLLISCCQKKEQQLFLLEAEAALTEQPEHTLEILQNIPHPEQLNRADYAAYLLLQVQAKYKNYLDIADDTLIHQAADYYVEQTDLLHSAMAFLYEGRVYCERKEYTQAMKSYLLGIRYAEQCKNNELLGFLYADLAWIYYDEYNRDRAIANYFIAKDYFDKAGNTQDVHRIYALIANVYLMNPAQVDSALVNYDRFLNYAETQPLPDSSFLSYIYKNKAVAYQEAKQWKEAQKSIRKAIDLDTKEIYQQQNYGILSEIYMQLGQMDSANYIATQMIEKQSGNYENSYYYSHLLYQLYKLNKQYESGLFYLEACTVYADSIYQEKKRQSVMEIQEKYNKEISDNNYRKKIVINWLISFAALMSVLLLFLIFFFKHKSQMNKKEKDMEEAQRMLNTLEELLAENTGGIKAELTQLLNDKMDLTRKLVQIQQKKDNEDFLKHYHSLFCDTNDMLDWENIYPVINRRYQGFVDKLRDSSFRLSEKELQLCCLLRAKFRSDEILAILSYSSLATLNVLKNRLHNKMGFTNINDFLKFIEEL
jgi:tetratricopeptide (TPR) repeat protein